MSTKSDISNILRAAITSKNYRCEYALECADAIEQLIDERIGEKLKEAYAQGRADALQEVVERGL